MREYSMDKVKKILKESYRFCLGAGHCPVYFITAENERGDE